MASLRRLFLYLALLFLIIVGGLVALNRDFVVDSLQLRGYRASSTVTTLATNTTMTSYAERLFLVNKPTLDDKAALNHHCSTVPTDDAVLGCFLGNRNGIYIYQVDEPLLNGVEQVTAAHEMLHQAYQRLGTSERTRVDAMLQDYYQHSLTDASVMAKMQSYQKSEPHDVLNEMHSVFGTEIATLPQPLEDYYKQYFTSRATVVAYRNQYQAEFDRRKAQIDAYDAQLTTLRAQIDSARADLDTREKNLQTQRQQMDTLLANNKIAQYNAQVSPYNASLTAYKHEVAETNQLINNYNALVEARNTISIQRTQLQEALDTRLDSAKKQ